jgi:hypothetical protein
MDSPVSYSNDNSTEEGKIPLGIRYLGACLLARRNDNNLRRAIAQADEGADLYEEAWQRRQAQLAKHRGKSFLGITKNWSSGVQYITRESRHDRAERKFKRYLKWAKITDTTVLRSSVENPETRKPVSVERGLKDWRARGFLAEELDFLREDFVRFKNFSLQAKLDKKAPLAVNELQIR